MLREQIKVDIAKAITNSKLPFDFAQGKQISKEEIEVRRSENPKFGDYATNLPLKIASSVIARNEVTKQSERKIAASSEYSTRNDGENYQSPMEIANILADSLKDLPYVKKLEAVNPGFVNFSIKPQIWQEEVEKVLNQNYVNLQVESRKVLVEFAHPNTHKLFHIGHLRNITTGESISRLLEAIGNEVVRVNYQGDVGLHIAKALWGTVNLGRKKPETLEEQVTFLAKAYAEGNKAYEEGGQKAEIDEINKKIYEKDPEVTKLWEETRQWSLDYFDRIYQRVGTKFDKLYFEGEVVDPGKEEVLAALAKGIFEESDGAVIFPGEKYGLHTRVFINSSGLPTYEAKDVGLAKLQFSEYSPDSIIHVVASEQKDYFKVLFKALSLIYPESVGKEVHLVYGWVRLREGKMSSRKGDVITAEWLLDEAKKKAVQILNDSDVKKDVDSEEVTEAVAVGAVKYAFLKMGINTDLVFDLSEAVNLNGNSGPYLQYTYARALSVLEKAGEETITIDITKMDPEEEILLRTLGHFDEAVLDSAKTLAPNTLANFLYEVSGKFNTFYNNLPILKAPEQVRGCRIFLTRATADVLKKGLYLLGVSALEKM